MNVKNSDNDQAKEKIVMDNISELLAHALALEIAASERYSDLSELMEMHNNDEIAKLFMKMAAIEKLHVKQICELISNHNFEQLPEKTYHWLSPEGPESTDPADMHYLMTPAHALNLALHNEQRACDYYANIAVNTPDEETRQLAQELAEEEKEHVALVRTWLEKFPQVDNDWDQDDDPPVVHD